MRCYCICDKKAPGGASCKDVSHLSFCLVYETTHVVRYALNYRPTSKDTNAEQEYCPKKRNLSCEIEARKCREHLPPNKSPDSCTDHEAPPYRFVSVSHVRYDREYRHSCQKQDDELICLDCCYHCSTVLVFGNSFATVHFFVRKSIGSGIEARNTKKRPLGGLSCACLRIFAKG